MASYEILPYVGVGPIRFGMVRELVCDVLRSGFQTFRRSPTSGAETDAFEELGIYVCYGLDGFCEAIELAQPASVVLQGEELVGRPFEDVTNFIRRRDSNVEVGADDAISFAIGIGIYASGAVKEPKIPVESVIVFRKGYYD